MGGDLKNVTDGQAELRIAEVSLDSAKQSVEASGDQATTLPLRVKRIVTNETFEALAQQEDAQKLVSVQGAYVDAPGTIAGPFIQHVKGSRGRVAMIKRHEGMWEVRRGHKVDGGERRQKEVRRKRYLQESQTTRPR